MVVLVRFPAHLFAVIVVGVQHVLLSEDGTGAAQLVPYRPRRSLMKALAVIGALISPAVLSSLLLASWSSLVTAVLALVLCLFTIVGVFWLAVGSVSARGGMHKNSLAGPEIPVGDPSSCI